MKATSAQQHNAVTGQSGLEYPRDDRGNERVAGRRRFSRNPIAAAVSGLLMAGALSHAYALPTGGNVVAGGAEIINPDANSMQITQTGSALIVNWQSFGIGSGERVEFIQNGSDAVALNRVVGSDPSLILGQLTASGRIFLVNDNGVLFGSGSSVDVGALVASTLDISDADFLAGNYNFIGSGSQGSVVNQGDITVAPGGFAALIGSQAINEGVISAQLGSVVLAAGDQVSMALDDSGLINLSVDKGRVDALASNSGLLKADGGLVLMSARSAGDLMTTVINNDGLIEANSLVERGGVVRLEASDSVANAGLIGKENNAGQVTNAAGMVISSGDINTSAAEANAQQGSITLSGSRVGVSGALLARGAAGSDGGSILINSSEKSVVTSTALLDTSGGIDSSAGKSVVWSDTTTEFSGSMKAIGGTNAGDGGTAEISGLVNLSLLGTVDISAANGQSGTLLLDPDSITIIDQSNVLLTAGLDPTLNALPVGTVLASDVNAAAGNYIRESTLEGLAFSGATLLLAATGSITLDNLVDNVLDLSGAASLTINAGGGFSYNDTLDQILTTGGHVNVNVVDVAQLGAITTGGGNLNVTSGGATLIYGTINTSSAIADGTVTISSSAIKITDAIIAPRSAVVLNVTGQPTAYIGTTSGFDGGVVPSDYKLDAGEIGLINNQFSPAYPPGVALTAPLVINAPTATNVLVGSASLPYNTSITSGGSITQEAGGSGLSMGATNLGLTLSAGAAGIGTLANPLRFNLGTPLSQMSATTAAGNIFLTRTAGDLSTSQTSITTGLGAQTVGLSAPFGSVKVDSAFNYGDDNLTLTSQGAPSQISVTGSLAGTGNLALNTDNANILGTINSGVGSVSIAPITVTRPIELGVGATTAGMLGLTDLELALITAAGGLSVGSATSSGAISLAGDATTTAGTSLSITTTGAIGGTGRLSSGGSLSLNAGAGIGDIAGVNPVRIGTLGVGGTLSAVNTTSGDLNLSTLGSVTLGGASATFTQRTNGALKVSSGGDILIAGDIGVPGAGSISLDALGSILEAAPAAGSLIASTVNLGLDGTTQSIGADVNGAVLTKAGTLNLSSAAGAIQVVNTGDVALTANATGGALDVSSVADIAVPTSTGAMSVVGASGSSSANVTLSSSGLFSNSALIDTAGAANTITINADKMALVSTIGDAADTVLLTSATTGNAIELGGANTDLGAALELSNAELSLVNGSLIIGDTLTSGNISLVGAVTRAGVLALRSSGVISDTPTGSFGAAVTSLDASAEQGISLTGNHAVQSVTLNNLASGDITYNSAVGVGNSLNLTATNTGTLNGAITVTESNGNLLATNVRSNGGAISLTASGGTLNIAGSVLTTNGGATGGNINYTANNVSLVGVTTAGTGTVNLTTATAANRIIVGAKDAVADPATLDVTAAELATITGNNLIIGAATQSGGISVAGNTSAGTDNLTLTTGGSILEQAGTVSTLGTLGLNAVSGIGAQNGPLLTTASAINFSNSGATGDVVISDSRAAGTTVSGSNNALAGNTRITETIGGIEVGLAGITGAVGSGSTVALTTSGVAANIADSAGGVLTADSVTLDATGAIGSLLSRMQSATGSLTAIARSGDMVLDNSGNLNLNATTTAGNMDVANIGTLTTAAPVSAAGSMLLSSTGDMSIGHDVTALTTLGLSVSGGAKLSHTAGVIDSTNNTSITLTADKMALLAGTIGNAVADNVTLKTNLLTDNIVLGGAAADLGDLTAATLELSAAEINTVTGNLNLGSTGMTGNIQVAGAINRANGGDINLVSGSAGGVTGIAIAIDNALSVQPASGLSITATSGQIAGNGILGGSTLNGSAATGINLSGDNAVADVTLNVTAAAGGAINYVSSLQAGNTLTFGATNNSTASAISLLERTGGLITNAVSSSGGAISLATTGVDAHLQQNGAVNTTLGGNLAGASVTLKADDMTLASTTNAGSAGSVTLTSGNANQPIELGINSAVAGTTLGLTDVELDTITAATLNLGDAAHTAGMSVLGAINPLANNLVLANGAGDTTLGANVTAINNLTVSTTGGAILGQGGTLAAGGNLQLNAARGIGDQALAAPVNIGQVGGFLGATNTTTGDIYLKTASITLGNQANGVSIDQQVNNGLLRVDANGTISLAGDLAVAGNGTVTLDATSSILTAAAPNNTGVVSASTVNLGVNVSPANIGLAGSVITTASSNLNVHSTGSAFVNNSGDVRLAMLADGGSAVLNNSGTATTTGSVTSSGLIQAAGTPTSAVTINATGDINIGHSVLGTSAVNLTAGDALLNAGRIIAHSAGLIDADAITLTSDRIDLNSTLANAGVGNAAADTIAISSTSAGNAMVLGSATDNTLELSNLELNTITGGLTLGSVTDTGTITAGGTVDRLSLGDLSLVTAAAGPAVVLDANLSLAATHNLSISAANGAVSGSGIMTAAGLTTTANDGISFSGTNSVGVVSLNNATTGNVSYNSASLAGVSIDGSNAAPAGTFSVSEQIGDLTVSLAGITTSGGNVTLSSAKTAGLLSVNGIVDTTLGGLVPGANVAYTADDMALTADTRTSGAALVTLTSNAAGQMIDLGSSSLTHSSLGLTDLELNTIKNGGGSLVIGDAGHTGQIMISQTVYPKFVNDLSLINSIGGIQLNANLTAVRNLTLTANAGGSNMGSIQSTPVQGSPALIGAGGMLTLNAATGIGSIGASAASDAPINLGIVGSVSANNTTSGDLFLHTRSITLGGVNSTLTQADNGVLRIDAEGDITLAGNVTVGGTSGKISLDAINNRILEATPGAGTLSAARIDLGMAGTTNQIGDLNTGAIFTASSDINAQAVSGSIRLNNTGNLLVNANSAGGLVDINNVGDLTSDVAGINATTSVKMVSTGNMNLTSNVTGPSRVDLTVTGAGKILTHTAGLIDANNAPINLTASKMALTGGNIGSTTGDTVTLSNSNPAGSIVLGSTTDTQAGALELSSAELNTIANAALIVGGPVATGTIQVNGPVNVTNAANLTVQNSAGGIILNNVLSATGNLNLIANSGGAVTGAITGTGTGQLNSGANLSLSAATGIGNIANGAPVRIGTVAGVLAATNSTSGDLFLATNSVTLGTANTQLSEVAGGHLRVDTTGDMTLGGDMTVTGGTITLNATGLLAQSTVGGGTLTANAVNIGTQSAPSAVGTLAAPMRTAGSLLNLNSAGDLFVTNSGNATLTMSVAGSGSLVNSAGAADTGTLSTSGVVNAGNLLDLHSSGVMTIGHNVTGTMGVNLAVTTANTALNQVGGVINASDAAIALRADKMGLTGTIGDSAGDSVLLTTTTATNAISLGVAGDGTVATLELSDAELNTVKNAALTIGGATSTGTITVNGVVTHVGNSNITLENHAGAGIALNQGLSSSQNLTLFAEGGAITRPGIGALSAVNGSLVLRASSGIGNIVGAAPVLIDQVGGNLSAYNTVSGDIYLETLGPITLGSGTNSRLEEVAGGELRVVSNGNMTLAGDLAVGAGNSGIITLEANGNIAESAAGASTLRAATVGFGTVGTYTVSNVGVLGAPVLTTATTAITSRSDVDAYISNTGNLGAFTATSNTGLIEMLNVGSLTTSGAITAANTVNIVTQRNPATPAQLADLTVTGNITGLNGVTLDAGTGSMLRHTAGVIDSNNALITLTADQMDLAGAGIGSTATDSIAIDTHNPAINIDLGSGVDTTPNTLELKSAELATLFGDVAIGSVNTTGAITVSQAITRANAGALTLTNQQSGIKINANLSLLGALNLVANGGGATVGNISSTANAGGVFPVLSATSLTAGAATGINLAGNNTIASVNLSNSSNGAINYVSNTPTLTVSANNQAANLGTVTVTETGGNMVVGVAGVTTLGNDIRLSTGAAGSTLSLTGMVDATAAGSLPNASAQVALSADDMMLGNTISAGSLGMVTLNSVSAARVIDLGSLNNTAGTLGLTDAELAMITADGIQIGDFTTHTGNIGINAPVLPTAANLTLSTLGAITNGLTGSVGATGNLQLNAGQGIGVIGGVAPLPTPAPVVISSLGGQLGAVNTTAGDIYIKSMGDITLGGTGVTLDEQVVNGTLKVESNGNINLAGDLLVNGGASGTIILDADVDGDTVGGAIAQSAPAASTLRAATVDLGSYTAKAVSTVTTLGSLTAPLQTSAATLLSSALSDTYLANSGNTTFTARSTGGLVSLSETGILTTALTGVDADTVMLMADDMALNPLALIGRGPASSILLSSRVVTDSIMLAGGTDTPADNILSLTSAELDSARGQLTIGGATHAGSITVPGAVTRTLTNGGITLQTSAGVNGIGAITADSLMVKAATGINLSGDNATALVDLTNSTSGNIAYVSNLPAGILSVSGSNAALNGTLNLTEKGGTLKVADNSVSLAGTTAGVGSNGGNIALNADQLDIASTINAGAGIVTITALTGVNGFDLGSATDLNPAAVELSAAEIANVTASVLRLGDLTNRISGSIQVSGAIGAPGVAALHLTTTGAINGAGSLTVAGLALESGSVALNGANDVTTLAGITSGAFSLNDINSLNIGTVDMVTGLTTGPGADLLLSTGGALTQTAGSPIASGGGLGIQAGGPVTLTDPANQIAESVAATVTGAGNGFALTTDGTGLSVGSVMGPDGVTPINGIDTSAGGGAIALTTAGTLTVTDTAAADDINAGSGAVTLTADLTDLQSNPVAGTSSSTAGGSIAYSPLTPNTGISLADPTGAGAGALSAAEINSLNSLGLSFGSLDSGPLTISGPLDLTTPGVVSDLALASGGAITQAPGAAIKVPNLSVATGNGGVTLTEPTNDVTKLSATVGYDANGNVMTDPVTGLPIANDLAYADATALDLGPIKVSGNAAITSEGDITGLDPVVVQGSTVLNTDAAGDGVAAGAGDIALTNPANDFVASVGVTKANDVSLVDANAVTLGPDLGRFNADGNLTVKANGAITDNAQLNILGDASFDAGFGNVVTIDPDGIDLLPAPNGDGLADDLNGDGTTDANGDGIIDVADTLPDNIGGRISVPSAGAVTIVDAGNTEVGSVTSNGKVDIASNGTLTMTPDPVTGAPSVIDNTLGVDGVTLTATGDANLGQTITNADVLITAGGSILDNNDPVGGNPANNITATNAILQALTGSVGNLNDPIEVELTGKLSVFAGGYDANGVSVSIDGNTADNQIHHLNNPPGLVLFNGVPSIGTAECIGVMGLNCESFLAATGGNIRVTLDNGEVVMLPSTVRHLDGLITLVNTLSRSNPVGVDFDTWIPQQDAGGGLIVPSDSGSILLPQGVAMELWSNQPAAVASLDLYQQQLVR